MAFITVSAVRPSMIECDVLIVGGGLSGLATARGLKGSGLKVLVLERMSDAVYRRYHTICGEAISDRMFRKAGMEPTAVVRRVDAIALRFGDDEVTIPVQGSIVDRNDLLVQLASECDVERLRGTATGVDVGDGGYIAHTTAGDISCRILVGADGAHSVVRRDVFGSEPEEMIPIINNIVRGESDGKLRFIVSERYKGAYRWEFPQKEGMMTIGYPKGTDDVVEYESRGGRHMPIGRLPCVARDGCYLVGDAGSLANPFCFGGIGAALVSGRKAAEAILHGDPGSYDRWVSKDRMFDRHYMEAHRRFSEYSDDDIPRLMGPLVKKYSVPRGFLAILRNPHEANVYMCCWLGFRDGW